MRGSRALGAAARAQLEHLAEEHEHGDDDGWCRSRCRPAPCMPEAVRKDSRGATVATALYTARRADAEADQREHVRADGSRTTATCVPKNGAAAPQHDRSRQNQSSIQFDSSRAKTVPDCPAVSMSPIVSRNTGAPRATPIQKRRVMSASFGVRRVGQVGRRAARGPCRISDRRRVHPARLRGAWGAHGAVWAVLPVLAPVPLVLGAGCWMLGALLQPDPIGDDRPARWALSARGAPEQIYSEDRRPNSRGSLWSRSSMSCRRSELPRCARGSTVSAANGIESHCIEESERGAGVSSACGLSPGRLRARLYRTSSAAVRVRGSMSTGTLASSCRAAACYRRPRDAERVSPSALAFS